MLRLLTGIFFLLAAFIYYDHVSSGPLSAEQNVVLAKGTGFQASVDTLANSGVISHPLFFKAIAYASGAARKVKAGEYHFDAGVSPQEILQKLVSGDVVKHKITVAEGLNVREIFALLKADPVLEGELPTGITEGSLLPETYYFTYGDTRASVVSRMQEAARKALAEAWEKRDTTIPISSPADALTLASIVEKETGLPAERPRVAAVFMNRLKHGMKLQSDPTTAYGIEQKSGKPLGRALTTADLETPTQYNTYTIDALPPAPIANPGKASLEAVMHPAQSDELYFVATGTGGHNFASTLDGHNKNVSAYHAATKQK